MRYRTFISFSSVVLVLGAVSRSRTRPADQSPGDPRPAAAVRLEIDAGYYAEKLGAEVSVLRASLEDSLLAILESEFAFVNWRSRRQPPPDTVVLRWVQPPRVRPPQVNLEISVRGTAAAASGEFGTTFEPFSKLSRRRDWSTVSVGSEWLVRFRALVDTNRSTLVARVFGALPLQTSVNLDSIDKLRAAVVVDPDSMRAPARSRPRFRLRGMLHDPGPSSEEVCELFLGACARQPQGYSCAIEAVRYLDTTLAAEESVRLLSRAQFRGVTVHIWEYRRTRFASDLVIGSGGRP